MVTPTYGALEALYTTVAASTLTQLYRQSFFLKAIATQFNDRSYFEQGETITIRRPKDLGEAEEYDPRGGTDATLVEPGHVITPLKLEKLFTRGFPTYSHDSNLELYINDYSSSSAGAIRKSVDNYLYNTGFRNYNIPAAGTVEYASNPPLTVIVKEDSNGNIQPFAKELLLDADAVLESRNVPSGNRFVALSVTAKANFLGETVLAHHLTESNIALMEQGLPMGALTNAYGFQCGGSNAIAGQAAVSDVGGSSPTNTINAIADDTTLFLEGDTFAATPLGAVQITLGTTPLPPEVAVGQIARIGVSNAAATAYGIILRVDSTTGNIWLVPCAGNGKKLAAANITPGTDLFSIPKIGSVNVAYHREHLVFASRLLNPPSVGSGAQALIAVDSSSGLVLQLFRGSYEINRFRESQRLAFLCGAKASDYRKSVLILST